MNRMFKLVGLTCLLLGPVTARVCVGEDFGDVTCGNLTVTTNIVQSSGSGSNTFAGKVGINTTSPSGLLHIKSAGTSTEPFRIDNSSGGTIFKVRQSLYYGDVYVYNSGGTSTVRLAGWSGSSPNSYFSDGLNLGTTTSGGATLYVKSKDTWPFIVAGTNSGYLFGVYCMGTDDGSSCWFDSGTGKVYVTACGSSYFNGGNVGIGTNNPSVALHVTGQGKFEQGLTYVAPLGDVSMGSYTNQ